MTQAISRTYSLEDYRELEEAAVERHEYRDGAIVAMSGGTIEHSALAQPLHRRIAGNFYKRKRGFIMELNKAVSVEYSSSSKTITVSFADGSKTSWPTSLLEFVRRTDQGWEPMIPTDAQLATVELYGGDCLLGDEIDTIFKIQDLQNRVYGRKAWMESLSAVKL